MLQHESCADPRRGLNLNSADNSIYIRLDIPADLIYLPLVGSCVKTMLNSVSGLQQLDVVTYNVELAVYETCTNIVQHAYGDTSGRIEAELTLTTAPARIVVDLFDTGSSFDISEVPDLPLDEPQVRGYGLFLVREIMDEVTYLHDVGRNHWRLVKDLVLDK